MGQAINDALLEACSTGRLDDVNKLIEQGADPNCKNGDGRTALMRASKEDMTKS